MDGYQDHFNLYPSRGKPLADVISMATRANDGIEATSYMNFLDKEEMFKSDEVYFMQGSKYEVPLERRIYEFRKCVDVKIYRSYVIISGDNHVTKIRFENNVVLGDMRLAGAGKMCKIRGTRNVAIIQTKLPNVVVISTKRQLCILYKISTTELQFVDQYRLPAYNNICFLGVLKHDHFCVSYTGTDYNGGRTSLMDSVTRGRRDLESGSRWPPTFETKRASLPEKLLIGMTCMDAFTNDEFIVGYENGIISYECFKMSIKKTELFENWSKPIPRGVTSICCHRNRIYVAIKREKRVMVLDRNGTTLIPNIIPSSFVIAPRAVSVYSNALAVSEYDRLLGISKVYIIELREDDVDDNGR